MPRFGPPRAYAFANRVCCRFLTTGEVEDVTYRELVRERLTQPARSEFSKGLVLLIADEGAAQFERRHAGRPRSREGIQHQVAWIGCGAKAASNERHGFLRRVFASRFSSSEGGEKRQTFFICFPPFSAFITS